MKQASFQLGEKTHEKNYEIIQENNIDFVETTSDNKSKTPIKRVENIYYFRPFNIQK